MSFNQHRFFCVAVALLTLLPLELAAHTAKASSLPQTEAEQTADVIKWLKTASEVTALVQDQSYRLPNFSQFFQDALRAGMSSLDPHSAFIKNYEEIIASTSENYTGIGVNILSKSSEDETLNITDVQDGGPAHKAGLLSGDKIVEVNGEKLKGLSTDEVIAHIKGKIGTTVKVKIIRKKRPLEFTVKRQVLKNQNQLCYFFKNQEIYYLSLKVFTENAAKQVGELLKKANSKQCRGLILDLRGNSGGILDSGVDVAGLFLEKGSEVVSTKNNKGTVISRYNTSTEPLIKSELPIFVLINNFTASAAEILAGCLRHYSEQQAKETGDNKSKHKLMVFLLGTTTFGKGSVQIVMPISNGCALKLTTMLYYLPNDVSIQQVGIAPDFTVHPKKTMTKEQKWMDELFGKESSLKNHITQNEAKGIKESDKDKAKKAEAESKKKHKEAASDDNDDDDDESENEAELAKGKSQEERIQEEISSNIQVQSCVNMITLLHMAKQLNPESVNTRHKALDFLKKNYASDDPLAIEKVK